jgi:hypothetical protein
MMLGRKFLLIICCVFVNLAFAQKEVLNSYPPGQDFYAGGGYQLFIEMVKIVKEHDLPPCENRGERYDLKILIYENSTISYVKDFDSIEIQKNKCAFDLSRKIIPHLKRWVPAKEEGKFVAAIAKININPLYLHYSKDDPRKNEENMPTFKKGMQAFGVEVKSIFEKKIKRNEDKRTFLKFAVNENGDMEDFQIQGSYTDSEKKEIINQLSKIKGKWNPATFNGLPFKYWLRQPITQNFDIQTEIEDRTKEMYKNLYNTRYR